MINLALGKFTGLGRIVFTVMRLAVPKTNKTKVVAGAGMREGCEMVLSRRVVLRRLRRSAQGECE